MIIIYIIFNSRPNPNFVFVIVIISIMIKNNFNLLLLLYPQALFFAHMMDVIGDPQVLKNIWRE